MPIDELEIFCYNILAVLLRKMQTNREGAVRRLKKKVITASALLFALLLAVGCTVPPEDVSSSFVSSAAPSELSVSEEPSADASSEESLPFEETSSEETSSEETSSEDTSSGFSPWREENEPDWESWRSPSIPEEGFSFLKKSVTLWMGNSVTIAYEFKPVGTTNRALTWSSSNEAVVTVEGGRVTAVGLGQATVRAETAGGRSAECRVTVVEPGTLSPTGALIEQLTGGDFLGWQFSLYDAELDGTSELFARRIGMNGVPQVTAYRLQDGAQVLSKSTGDDDEWAVWRRKDGSRYLLLSYTERTATGGKRYVLDEVSAGGIKTVFARETANDGTVTYYAASGGTLSPCSEQTYDSKRKTYFSDNRQLPETVLTWVTGLDTAEIERALNNLKPLN